MLNTRASMVPQDPYVKSKHPKSAQSNPEKLLVVQKRQHDERDDFTRESLFFEKYACLCPGTMSLQVSLASSIFRPGSDIDLDFDLSKVYSNISMINVTFVMDLKVYSLANSKVLIEHISKEMGTETLYKEDIVRNSDGKSVQHTFQMSQIQEKNEFIRDKYLKTNPYGVNVQRATIHESGNYQNNDAH